ncbi:MAG: efflux RND transporter permease subunit [Faecousia sp.]
MPKFSVKKPFTIFVAVVAILVLGVVAYTKMTPDLLPNMDFPYVMIMTTYPGANSEQVETEITRPMEQSMATLEHIKEVTSSSGENFSIVMLEFEESVNMDTIGVDIQQNISALSGAWDEMVGTPYVLKINPSLMPVQVAGVSMQGMTTMELTEFLEDTLLNELEGIPGVARISTTGMVQQEIHVVLDQKKFDALNQKIADAINGEIDEAVQELEEQQAELRDAERQIADAKKQINKVKNGLSNATDAATSGVRKQMEQTAKDQYEQIENLTRQKEQLAGLNQEISRTESELEELRQQQEANPDMDLSGQIAALSGNLEGLKAQKASLEAYLWSQGVNPDNIDASIRLLEAALEETLYGMDQLENMSDSVKEVGSKGIDSLTSQITQGSASISSAKEQIEAGFEQIEEGREAALKQADLNNIITMNMVSQILTAQNFSMPAGLVKQDGIEYMVGVGDEMTDIKELENMMLFDMGMEDLDPIYLKDVAVVALTDNQAETYAKLDGENGIVLSFEKQSTYATAETTNNINERFRELEAEYPGLKFVSLMNQGDYIYLIVDSIVDSLLLGALFAILVLYLFLGDLRPTIITLCAIPISVIFAIVLMYFSGVTINMISLSGLAVAVGMLVDNSVVVIENIYRLRSRGANVIQAAVSGAQQVAGAVTASTLTTVCVFVPIVFVEGITRQLFTDLALTMTYALLASLLVSLTLVPAMASGMLRKEKKAKDTVMTKFLAVYQKMAAWALDHKILVLGASLALLILSASWSLSGGFIFMPEMDMPNVDLSITMPEGATMEEASALADEVLARIDTVDGIATVGAMMSNGSSLMGGSSDDTLSMTVYITLADETASGAAVSQKIEALCADMPCEVTGTSAMMDMSALSSSGVGVQVFGEDMDTLQEGARKAAELLRGVTGIAEVSDGLEDAAPALHVAIDRNKTMGNGITVAQIFMELSGALTETKTATTLKINGTSTDVIIEKQAESLLDVDGLKNYGFEVTGTDGETKEFTLADVATVEETSSLSTIQRLGQRRYVTVTGTLEPGYNVTLVSAQVQEVLENADLGPGVEIQFSGENEAIMEAMEQLLLMLLLGILLVYLVMVAQFQSLKSPFIVMFTIPLAFTGGFMGLLVCGMEVSVISLIGFVMLTGIIVNNGIVLVDYINQLRLEGMERRAAILEAAQTRMRPILMTTITTILGLADMAVRQSAGTALMRPVAVVCIGGLTYATLMTLFVVPCIYDIMNKKDLRHVREEDLALLEL